jgi:5'(3')-deoxyribonucleotidase
MDGVVADWDTAAELFLGTKKQSEDGRWNHESWQRLRENQRFFATLPLMHRADELVNLAREFRTQGWQLLFLTAIPRNNDHPWAFYDKMTWAQTHFPDIAVHFGPYSEDKQIHAQPGDILVDDRWSNIEQWRTRGGVGIKVSGRDLDQAILELRSHLASA